MSRRPWHRRYHADYIAATQHLTMLEDGAYTRLLDHVYACGRPMIQERDVYRVAVAMDDDERAAVDRVLEEFWALADGAWTNPRAARELEISDVRSEAGKKGGRPKAKPKQTESKTESPSRARGGQYQIQRSSYDHQDENPAEGPIFQAPPAAGMTDRGPNGQPSSQQLGYLASLAEELSEEVQDPRTRAEASQLINRMRIEVERRRSQAVTAAREQGRIDGKVQGRHQQAEAQGKRFLDFVEENQ